MDFQPLQVGSITLDPVLVMLALATLAVLALLLLAIILLVNMGRRRDDASAHSAHLGEMKVRLQTLAESSVTSKPSSRSSAANSPFNS